MAAQKERGRIFKVRESHSQGARLLKRFALKIQRYDVVSRNGLLWGSHPMASEILELFILWAAGLHTPSQVPKIYAGAINASIALGTLGQLNLAPHIKLVRKYRNSHVKGPRMVVPQKDYVKYLIKASARIFGPSGHRKPVNMTVLGDVNNWLIAVACLIKHIRPSEMVNKVQYPADPESQFRVLHHVKKHPDPTLLVLQRPTKQLRQKGSNKMRDIPFAKTYSDTDQIVSLAETLDHIVKKAKESGKERTLGEPLVMDSPNGFRKGVPITTKSHTAWRKDLARKVGFPAEAACLFTCRNTRRCAMTSTVDSALNSIHASHLVRHADPKTTAGYFAPDAADTVRGHDNVLIHLTRKYQGTGTSNSRHSLENPPKSLEEPDCTRRPT